MLSSLSNWSLQFDFDNDQNKTTNGRMTDSLCTQCSVIMQIEISKYLDIQYNNGAHHPPLTIAPGTAYLVSSLEKAVNYVLSMVIQNEHFIVRFDKNICVGEDNVLHHIDSLKSFTITGDYNQIICIISPRKSTSQILGMKWIISNVDSHTMLDKNICHWRKIFANVVNEVCVVDCIGIM